MKILFPMLFLWVFAVHADEYDCIEHLKKSYHYHHGWFYGNVVLTAIPPITFFTAANISFNKKMAKRYKRAMRLVEQAHREKTSRDYTPELMWLVDSLKRKNSSIKKSYVKNVIRDMAHSMDGLCKTRFKDFSQERRSRKKSQIIATVYRDLEKRYELDKEVLEDHEETTMEEQF